MALSRRQKYIVLAGMGLIVLLIFAIQLISVVFQVNSLPSASISRDDDQMTQGYEQVTATATQNDVIGIMGSQFAVLKCPRSAPDNCAHIWHYESGSLAWDFTFDVDGNLMKKAIATTGE